MFSQPSGHQRAIFGTALFSGFGFVSGVVNIDDWKISLPIVALYIALVGNTFFSIRYFSAITPADDRGQKVMDGLLIVCYGIIAANIAHPIRSMYAMAVMFIIATGKYLLLQKKIGPLTILTRKIWIDVLGATMFGLAVLPMIFGYVQETSWIVLGLYLLVNAYLVQQHLIDPSVRADVSSQK